MSLQEQLMRMGLPDKLAELLAGNSAGVVYYSGGSGSTQYLALDTLDGADSKRLFLTGGGVNPSGVTPETRGAYVQLEGNDYVAGARAIIGGTSGIRLEVGGTFYWGVESTGNLKSQGALAGIQHNIGTLAAAGTTITDAAQVATTVCRVTGANGTVGVKLPAIASVGFGQCVTIINSDTTNALKVYSNAAGETITGQSGSTAISLAAKLMLRCWAYDATNWYAEKGVIPY